VDTEGDATPEMMRTAHQGILRLVLALNALLPKIGRDGPPGCRPQGYLAIV